MDCPYLILISPSFAQQLDVRLSLGGIAVHERFYGDARSRLLLPQHRAAHPERLVESNAYRRSTVHLAHPSLTVKRFEEAMAALRSLNGASVIEKDAADDAAGNTDGAVRHIGAFACLPFRFGRQIRAYPIHRVILFQQGGRVVVVNKFDAVQFGRPPQ